MDVVRFAFAHKLSTYLAVMAAFFAIALSGELNPLAVMLAFVAIVASWWWEPPRVDFDRWTRFWTVMSVVMFGLAVFVWFAGWDILLTGSHFLLYLLVAKLFSRRAAKDYQQVYVLTFLMLVSGTVLNPGFSYGVFFLGFVVFSTWALILFHLRREMEENFLLKHTARSSERVQVQRILNSKRIVGGRFFVGTSIMSLLVFIGATVMFLAIPRIGLGLFYPKKRGGVSIVGFSDTVKLGGHGTIKDDPTVVMRVYIDEEYQGRGAPEIHWRGVAFDKYDKGEWTRSEDAPRAEVTHDYDEVHQRAWVHLRYARFSELSVAELNDRIERGVRQEIYLEPLGTDVLFGAAMPLVFEFDTMAPKERIGKNDEIRHPHGAGIKYVVYSDLDPPRASVLRAIDTTLPPEDSNDYLRVYRVYLQGKDQMTGRFKREAVRITRNAPTAYDKAVAIEAYLRTEFDYTLRMVAPPRGQDPIDFFLFDRGEGHCEYFASAMTMMLRTLDIPARNVNGFLGGAWNEYGDYIAVRGGDAHSWVEVFFPGAGWVTFDPTPAADRSQLGRGGTGLLEKLRRFMDTLRLKWFQWVIEYDLHRQLKLFKSIRSVFGGGKFRQGFASARAWLSDNKRTAGIVLVSVLAPIALLLWLRRRRRSFDPLGGERPLTRSQSAIAAVYAIALQRWSRRGHKRAGSATPREFAQQLRAAAAPGAADFAALTELYYAAIYGGDERPASLTRARDLRDAVNDAWKNRKRAARTAGADSDPAVVR